MTVYLLRRFGFILLTLFLASVIIFAATQLLPGDVAQVRFDASRMEGLGWKPRYASDEAVRQAIRDILREIN